MWYQDDKVLVSLPYGDDGKTVHAARVLRVMDPGPLPDHPRRTVKVAFEDPLVYGGLGVAWVDPLTLVAPDEDAAEPERDHES